MGKKPKEVLDAAEIDDLMLAVRNGNTHLVEGICLKFKIVNVCEVRGLGGEFALLSREMYSLQNWNMLLVAVAFNHLAAIRYFTKELECHLRVSLRSPPVNAFSKMQESSPQQAEAFALLVAVNNRNNEMLAFLWNELRLLWDSYHLEYLVEELSAAKFKEGIRTVLRSQTAHEIYMGMRAQDKIEMLQNLLVLRQSKRSLEVMETLKDEMTQHPYATVALFVLVNDPKQQYTLHANHLDKCLEQVDAAEYARYKFSKAVAQFHEQVIKVVNEYSNQEENSQ